MIKLVNSKKSFNFKAKKACKVLAFGLAVAASWAPCMAATTAPWPTAPITFVAPFSAGGGGDTLTRLYAQQLNLALNVPVIVDNKPGAGGNIGTSFVAKAAPDGQTVVFGTSGTMGTNHFLYKRTGYSINDFEPVAMFGMTGLVLVVAKDAPYKNLGELIAFGKSNPGKLSCASDGNGTASHIACAMLQQKAGIEVEHIPYKGSSAGYIDVRSQRVSFFIDVTPPLTPQIKEGSLRALAVTMKKRIPALPDVPTFAESGLPDYELFAWDGVFAPKGTPTARLDRLHEGIQSAVKNPEFSKNMMDRGTMLQAMTREDFRALVRREYERMGPVVKQLGVTID
ncbi:MAG: tripartite tricarboxylate transporter substrate binding protein [Polaromonas sp.]|nr:tripartite tricarboxylate transporter substrate binding protein [Polaromonas sp.]